MSSLIVISCESNWKSLEEEASVIDRIISETGFRVHLRKHHFTEKQMLSLLELLREDSLPSILVHSHHDLAKEVGVGGIHYSEKDFDLKNDLNGNSNGLLVSTSFHDIEQCHSSSEFVNYSFLCPVFDSISSDKTSPFQWQYLSGTELPKSVYALGGVNKENLPLIKDSSFTGAALKGALWSAEDPLAYATECKELWSH